MKGSDDLQKFNAILRACKCLQKILTNGRKVIMVLKKLEEAAGEDERTCLSFPVRRKLNWMRAAFNTNVDEAEAQWQVLLAEVQDVIELVKWETLMSEMEGVVDLMKGSKDGKHTQL